MSEIVEERRGWHVVKEIPLALIVTIVLAVGSSVITSAVFMTKIINFMDTTAERFEDQEKRDAAQDRQISLARGEHVARETLVEMFRTKDAEIASIKSAIDRAYEIARENNQMLSRLLHEFPRRRDQ